MAKDKKTKRTKKDKELSNGLQVLFDAAVSQQKMVDYHASKIPMDYDFDPDTKSDEEIERVAHAVYSVWAIEEEWILDPDLREELSAVQTYD